MAERVFQTPENKQGLINRIAGKGLLGWSLITLPIGIYTGVIALWSENNILAALGGGSAFLDWTQIRQRNRPMEKKSWYNSEKILHHAINIFSIGKKRFQEPYSARMLTATA